MDGSMELLIEVCFWIGVFSMVLRLVCLGSYTVYPRKITRGDDAFNAVIHGAFLIWAATLIFGT